MKHSRLFVSVGSTALLMLGSLAVAPAQDVMKVSPETHTVLVENDQVRVLQVRIKPGEKVGVHSHPGNVSYYLSNAKVRLTFPDGKSLERELKAGAAVWNDPTTHSVENIGTTELQEIQIEVKGAQKPAMSK